MTTLSNDPSTNLHGGSSYRNASTDEAIVRAHVLAKRSFQVWSVIGVLFLIATAAQIAGAIGQPKPAAPPVVAAALVAPTPPPAPVVEAVAVAPTPAPTAAVPSAAAEAKPAQGAEKAAAPAPTTAKVAKAKPKKRAAKKKPAAKK